MLVKLGRLQSVREQETAVSPYKFSACSCKGDDRFVYFQQTTFVCVFADGLGERSNGQLLQEHFAQTCGEVSRVVRSKVGRVIRNKNNFS